MGRRRHAAAATALLALVALPSLAAGFVVPPAAAAALSRRTPTAPVAASSPNVADAGAAAGSTPAPHLSQQEAATRREELKAALLRSLKASMLKESSADGDGVDPVLVCPVSLQPLRPEVRLAGPFGEVRSLVTPDGRFRYPANDVFADLVSAEDRGFTLAALAPRQDLFRSPLTSFLYERGWRDNFKLSGFPGIEEEHEDLLQFMAPLPPETSTILDLSCGSGLMARRLVRSGRWRRVVAADYSESMLRETRGRFKEAGLACPTLVRADAARLPFRTGSLQAVHAGAALHCWPRLEEGLREVHRVLAPGGRFYASTFEVNPRLRSDTFKFFQLDELSRRLKDSGFETVNVRREGMACLIAHAVKAPAAAAAAGSGSEPAAASAA